MSFGVKHSGRDLNVARNSVVKFVFKDNGAGEKLSCDKSEKSHRQSWFLKILEEFIWLFYFDKSANSTFEGK